MNRSYSLLLTIIVVAGLLGTALDLLLLGHTEDFSQYAPLLIIGLSLVAFLGLHITKTKVWLTLTRVSMILLLVTGVAGLWLHFDSNVEFEKEMYPNMLGFKLFLESVKGAVPTLAPGAMIMLGLTGLLKTFETLNNN